MNYSIRFCRPPGRLAVVSTWGISLSVLLLIITSVVILITNFYFTPITVWGHRCHGWFPECRLEVCVDSGNGSSSVMPNQYQYCSRKDTINKVIGNTCIFDYELYRLSDKSVGFDFCVNNFRGLRRVEKFEEGVYILDDNFDFWKNSTDYSSDSVQMLSGKWSKMMNAEVTDICGFNNFTRKYEIAQTDRLDFSRKPSALVFSGVQFRYAETVDLNLTNGGRVDFYLKFAPVVLNELTTLCKTAFGGDITLSFSTDKGESWVYLSTYPVWKFRKDEFKFVTKLLPMKSWSNCTRIKWEQNTFDSKRDFWAVDDVKIFHHFDSNWKSSSKQIERMKDIQKVQCCLGTAQCLQFPNDQMHNHHDKCEIAGKDYKSIADNSSLRVQIFMALATLLALFRNYYCDLLTWFLRNSSRYEEKYAKGPVTCRLKTFSMDIEKSWQIFAVTLLGLPNLLSMIYLGLILRMSSNLLELSSSTVLLCLVGCLLDMWSFRWISSNVLQFWPCHILPEIIIDTNPEFGTIQIGNNKLPLTDVSRLDSYSENFYLTLCCAVMISGLPVATCCILLKSLKLSYRTYKIAIQILGGCTIFRSLLGPTWIVKIFFAFRWILSISKDDRNELGRSLRLNGVQHITSYCCIISVTATILFIVNSNLRANAAFLLLIITACLGSLIGGLIGLLKGVPVAADIYLTTWPKSGYSLTHQNRKKLPCLFNFTYCGSMNSYCQLQIINLRNMESFCYYLRYCTKAKNDNEVNREINDLSFEVKL